MTCPGCHRVIPVVVDRCPHCNYNAWTCVDHFPYSPPPLDRYVDVENRLSNEDRARIDRAIDTLEADLPQVGVHLCIVRLLPGTDARECGFWMLNACIPRDEEEARNRPWSVLLLIDTHALAASATVGYGLDPFVGDEQLRAALAAGQPDWLQGNFGAGALKFVHQLQHALTDACRLAIKSARKSRRQPPAPASWRPVIPAPPKARHPES
jgi:TPM domain